MEFNKDEENKKKVINNIFLFQSIFYHDHKIIQHQKKYLISFIVYSIRQDL
jgi:hypothetical protein